MQNRGFGRVVACKRMHNGSFHLLDERDDRRDSGAEHNIAGKATDRSCGSNNPQWRIPSGIQKPYQPDRQDQVDRVEEPGRKE